MHQRIAQTRRWLARLINQDIARTNAAEGSADLRTRRHEQERVDEYLLGRLLTFPSGVAESRERDEHYA